MEMTTTLSRNTVMMRLLAAFARKSNTAEGAAIEAGLGPDTGYWKRVSDLKAQGFLEHRLNTKGVPMRLCTSSGRDAYVLRVTDSGRAHLRAHKNAAKATKVVTA